MELTIMGNEALGAYIRVLRQNTQPKMTQKKLAELIGTTNNTIYRIEAGIQEPQEFLAALLTTLGGRIADIYRLRSDGASVDLAEQLAEQAITERVLLDWAHTDERRMRLLQRIRDMSSDDPDLRARLEGYLDQLQAH